MKNHLKFWGEHPIISHFWLIVHTATVIWLAFAVAINVAAAISERGILEKVKQMKVNDITTKLKNIVFKTKERLAR